ncbi:MAG: hypothetical protein IKB02_01900, partial [Clostridia bacterium]|nr:hypothetical protein [Clostridia bacterium]
AIDIYYFNSGRAITASGVFFDEPIGFSVWNAPRGLSQATSTAGGHDFDRKTGGASPSPTALQRVWFMV